MTRTRRVVADGHDRHLQRNGGDVRFLPKKGGFGRGNWGSMLADLEWDAVDAENAAEEARATDQAITMSMTTTTTRGRRERSMSASSLLGTSPPSAMERRPSIQMLEEEEFNRLKEEMTEE
ncbi:hypothetical protein HK405_014682 [Cladochytrium tenue]|nr:hypothetical protein HK405_014682 [Cladochytrium tenue]